MIGIGEVRSGGRGGGWVVACAEVTAHFACETGGTCCLEENKGWGGTARGPRRRAGGWISGFRTARVDGGHGPTRRGCITDRGISTMTTRRTDDVDFGRMRSCTGGRAGWVGWTVGTGRRRSLSAGIGRPAGERTEEGYLEVVRCVESVDVDSENTIHFFPFRLGRPFTPAGTGGRILGCCALPCGAMQVVVVSFLGGSFQVGTSRRPCGDDVYSQTCAL